MLQIAPTISSTHSRPGDVRTLARVMLCAFALLCAWRPVAAETSGPPAPDFALRSLAGQNVRLSEHLGEVVLINFWASWCGACREQMPHLEELFTRYRRAGLVLLGVTLDENRARAADMAATLRISYPLLLDERKEVSRAYGVDTLPVTVLIDRAGSVRYVASGYKPGYEQRYAEKLRELLNE